jgi:hypothetical protein
MSASMLEEPLPEALMLMLKLPSASAFPLPAPRAVGLPEGSFPYHLSGL